MIKIPFKFSSFPLTSTECLCSTLSINAVARFTLRENILHRRSRNCALLRFREGSKKANKMLYEIFRPSTHLFIHVAQMERGEGGRMLTGFGGEKQSRFKSYKSCHLSVHARSSTHYRWHSCKTPSADKHVYESHWKAPRKKMEGWRERRWKGWKGFWSKLVIRLLARETLFHHIQFARRMNELWALPFPPNLSLTPHLWLYENVIQHACKCEKT